MRPARPFDSAVHDRTHARRLSVWKRRRGIKNLTARDLLHGRVRFLGRNLLRAASYMAGLALLFVLGNAVSSLGTSDHNSPGELYSRLFSPSILYPYLTGAGSRMGSASHTTVITIGKDELALLETQDNCSKRRLIADVLTALRDLKPSAIVVDYEFNPAGCGSASTLWLRRALVDVSSSIPIVLGQNTWSFDELRERWPSMLQELQMGGFRATDLFIEKDIPFKGIAPRVETGLVRLNADNRKIPIAWPVRQLNGRVVWTDTLAFAAAKAGVLTADKTTAAGRKALARLADLRRMKRHPLSSFFDESKLLVVPAIRVICSNGPTMDSDCSGYLLVRHHRISLETL